MAVRGLVVRKDPLLIAGFDGSEDAGVYKLTPDIAIIQTVDFFTPIVDDPYEFGQIAAANSLSDVYAMGGVPIVAMNVVCYPCSLGMEVLRDILRGGADKVYESGAVLVGGHSVDDKEPKYGLSVTGTVHPDKVVLNKGARPGDVLVLTKPLGTGVISTALKGEMVDPHVERYAYTVMSTLNASASAVMQEIGVHACTDITGFGFLGHLAEMADASDVSFTVYADAVPVIDGALDYIDMGLAPAGLHRNWEHVGPVVEVGGNVDRNIVDAMCDPQTSGGLLIALASDKADELVRRLKDAGALAAAIVGEACRRGPEGPTITVVS
jgi:selenide,water dikinase